MGYRVASMYAGLWLCPGKPPKCKCGLLVRFLRIRSGRRASLAGDEILGYSATPKSLSPQLPSFLASPWVLTILLSASGLAMRPLILGNYLSGDLIGSRLGGSEMLPALR